MRKGYIRLNKNKYFFETDSNVPFDESGITLGIRIKKKLYEGKSKYQKIKFFDTFHLGKALVLDDIFQTAEKTEFIYHEMLCQVPMFSHKNPKNVLIVGGGDGGSLEEVLKHKSLEKAVMVEIDEKVVDLSKKYLPSISKKAFKDKRAELIIGDGKKYIQDCQNEFDIIILDLSDPHGPATDLVSENFYRKVKKALKRDGMVSIQSASFFCQPKLTRIIYKRIKKIFPYVEIRMAAVPEYGTGEFSFALGSKADLGKTTIATLENKFKKSKLDLKYYSPEIHFSSRVLPKYIEDKIIV